MGTNPLPDTGGYWNDSDSSTTVDVFGGIAFKISVDFYVLFPIQSVTAFFIINYVTLILIFVIKRIFSLVKTFANSSQESQQSLMMLMPTGRYIVQHLPLVQVFQVCLCPQRIFCLVYCRWLCKGSTRITMHCEELIIQVSIHLIFYILFCTFFFFKPQTLSDCPPGCCMNNCNLTYEFHILFHVWFILCLLSVIDSKIVPDLNLIWVWDVETCCHCTAPRLLLRPK